MMLVDEKKLSLDDRVIQFIPQLNKWMVVEEKDDAHILLKPPVRPVTIRHILSHTSGLAGIAELQRETGSDSTPLKVRALSSVTGPLQSQPGDKYAYGNQGMNIAARIVEIVSGMSYQEFLQTRFFDPLGMTETTFWPSETQVARLAGTYGPNEKKNGYVRGGLGFLTKPYSDRVHRFPEAGGGLFSTAHDIFRYGLMLANDGELDGKRYLSHAAMEELRKEQTGTTKVNYSLGYHLRNGMRCEMPPNPTVFRIERRQRDPRHSGRQRKRKVNDGIKESPSGKSITHQDPRDQQSGDCIKQRGAKRGAERKLKRCARPIRAHRFEKAAPPSARCLQDDRCQWHQHNRAQRKYRQPEREPEPWKNPSTPSHYRSAAKAMSRR